MLMKEMKDHGLKSNVYTFGGIINQLGRAGQCAMAFQLLNEMVSIKITPNEIILCGVEQACERCIGDDRVKARKLLAEQRMRGGIGTEQLERLSSALERQPRLPVRKFVAKVVPEGHGSSGRKQCQNLDASKGRNSIDSRVSHGGARASVSSASALPNTASLHGLSSRKLCQFFDTPKGCFKGAACTFSHGGAGASVSAASTIPNKASFTTTRVFAEQPQNAAMLTPPAHFPTADEEQVNPITDILRHRGPSCP